VVASAERRRAALGLLADVGCVLAFVLIGRANHHAGDTLAGVASTSWPFLAGLAAGEAATRAWRRPFALVPTGAGVLLATVVIGQVLRVLAGQGTAVAFIIVSLLFLGLFLLGWRAVAQRISVS
jgi:FtsH-binding integral membrane protein